MKGGIFSEEVRSAGDKVIFNVDMNGFEDDNVRIITKNLALDGSVVYKDAGYFEDTGNIRLSNVLLSTDDYDIIVGMMRDASNTFVFCFRHETWRVLVAGITSKMEGAKRVARMVLSVIQKYADMETS